MNFNKFMNWIVKNTRIHFDVHYLIMYTYSSEAGIYLYIIKHAFQMYSVTLKFGTKMLLKLK